MSRTARDNGRARKPKGPSPSEVRAEWARTGDVEALWRLLSDSRWDDIDQEDVLKLLVQALEVRSRSDPAQFAADVFTRMTILVTSLVFRSHLHLANCVEQNGRAVRRRAQPPGDLPEVAVESLLPRVVQMQEHLATLFMTQSSVARQWSLVRKNRAKGERARADEPLKTGGNEGAKSAPEQPTVASTNGHTHNRLAGLLNSHGRRPDDVHHGD